MLFYDFTLPLKLYLMFATKLLILFFSLSRLHQNDECCYQGASVKERISILNVFKTNYLLCLHFHLSLLECIPNEYVWKYLLSAFKKIKILHGGASW